MSILVANPKCDRLPACASESWEDRAGGKRPVRGHSAARVCSGTTVISLLLLGAVSARPASAEHPLLTGYLDHPALTQRVNRLAADPHIQASSLGTTRGGYTLHLLTLSETKSASQADSRPAILIVGGTDASRPVGTEMAIRLAEGLAGESELLKRVTFYIIPQANPDGSARLFQSPYRASHGNAVRTDDDLDGSLGEDPPEDLDGDGFITSMRVYRSGGAYRPDETDARVDVSVQPGDEKPGEYDLYPEGIDNDQDHSWNEDPGDGVDFNRNFTFQYQPFTRQSGQHPVSEVESRAVADFAWDHPNIMLVVCLGPPDNLYKAWAAGPSRSDGPITTSLNRADEPYYRRWNKLYSETVKSAEESDSNAGGDLLHWSYYHFGRWALGTPSWGIPEAKSKDERKGDRAEQGAEAAESASPSAAGPDDPNPSPPDGEPGRPGGRTRGFGPPRERGATTERPGRPPFAGRFPFAIFRGGRPDAPGARSGRPGPGDPAQDRRALQWMDAQKIAGFTSWTRFEHPDFPGQRVEVGGFRPWWRTNPPAQELDALASAHQKFIVAACQLLPTLVVEPPAVESLGSGVLRITARVANTGYLPTSSHHGADKRLTYPVQVEIKLPESAELIQGSRRRRSENIDGGGAAVEHTWLIRTPDPSTGTITVRASSLMVGEAESSVPLKSGA